MITIKPLYSINLSFKTIPNNKISIIQAWNII